MDHRSIIWNMADLKGTPNRMQSPTKNIDGGVSSRAWVTGLEYNAFAVPKKR